MMFILSLIVPIVIGFIACHVFFKGTKKLPFRFMITLAVPFGIGISSFIFIFLSLLGLSPLLIFLLEVIVLIFVLIKYKKSGIQTPYYISYSFNKLQLDKANINPLLLLATTLYLFSWAMDVGVFYFNTIQAPHGLWDAWSCWNLLAKFISRAPNEWPQLFHQMNAVDFHPDYPLLQRGFIANSWALIGDETVWIPVISAFVFTFCTIGLITSSIRIFNSKIDGLIAGLVLLCTPFFMVMGYSQYADNTVGFFYLATVVLLTIARGGSTIKPNLLIAAGIAAGLAAYSKNEGLLFIVCLFVSQLTHLFFKNYRELLTELKFLFLGMLPFLLLIGYQKLIIAPPNQIVSAQGSQTIAKLSDPERYQIVVDWFIKQFTEFGKWEFHPWWFFLLGIIFKGVNVKRNNYSFVSNITLILLMATGFFFVEIITPLGLVYYLSTSVHRLFFQLFPTFIFVYFMAINGKQTKNLIRWIEKLVLKNTSK